MTDPKLRNLYKITFDPVSVVCPIPDRERFVNNAYLDENLSTRRVRIYRKRSLIEGISMVGVNDPEWIGFL
jgi:hypothetical protein